MFMERPSSKPRTTTRRRGFRRHSKRRGAAAILAMMFLVIFGALATAMAIVAQGNLSTADSHLKINRTLAAAETGLNFVMYRLNKVTKGITTSSGLIDETNAPTLWNSVRASMLTSMAGEVHHCRHLMKQARRW